MISVVIISKDEPELDRTLGMVREQLDASGHCGEIIVVDASEGRLEAVRHRHEGNVDWIDFVRPRGVGITIPHQRNAGIRRAKGEIVVCIDSGCEPGPLWLTRLVAPLLRGESAAYGLALGTPGSRNKLYDRHAIRAVQAEYLNECSTINFAFRRDLFDAIGGFDERFAYGSDVDFSWRLSDAGYRIRTVPDAIVRHDWGGRRRQRRRSYQYGRARVRLHRKHRHGLRYVLRTDPMVVVYPLFLVGLPLTLVFPLYPALLLIPAWRNRADGPVDVVVDHLIFGYGVLAELLGR
jgi:glycosyltransferase involved in cell wall biosynthesis